MTASIFHIIGWTVVMLGQPQQPLDTPVTEPLDEPLGNKVRAVLRTDRRVFPAGGNIMVEFVMQNTTAEPVDLKVPGALAGQLPPDYGMGLPLEHVFSGANFRGLDIVSELNPNLGGGVTRKPDYPVPPLRLAPFATVGLRFDVTRFYPALRQAGTYRIQWQPYGGAVASEEIEIEVVTYKEAIIETDRGRMRMQLLYGDAPKHVENFIELADDRFFNNRLVFFMQPNEFLLTGCPNDDGSGARKDNATVPFERTNVPFEFGTVGMALIDGKPGTGSSQFFISMGPHPTWRDRYTAFGKITGPESQAVLRRIAETPVDEYYRPTQPIRIRSISIVNAAAVR